MYVCNTGLECEECVGGCEQNLEWDDDLELAFFASMMNVDPTDRKGLTDRKEV